MKVTFADDMTPEDIAEVSRRWTAAQAERRTDNDPGDGDYEARVAARMAAGDSSDPESGLQPAVNSWASWPYRPIKDLYKPVVHHPSVVTVGAGPSFTTGVSDHDHDLVCRPVEINDGPWPARRPINGLHQADPAGIDVGRDGKPIDRARLEETAPINRPNFPYDEIVPHCSACGEELDPRWCDPATRASTEPGQAIARGLMGRELAGLERDHYSDAPPWMTVIACAGCQRAISIKAWLDAN